jgi:hypothetical protein
VFSAGLHAARSGDRYTRATVVAQSQLAGLSAERGLQEGVISGTTNDAYHWKATLSPYTDDQLPETGLLLRPLVVAVEVTWEEGGAPRTVSVSSILLGGPQR